MVDSELRIAEYSIVVLGASMGGLHAMQVVLSGLSREFPLPVVLLQHRGFESNDALASILQGSSAMPVLEAEDKMEISPQHVYLAPTGYHLLIEDGHFALSTDAPVRFARPSIDVLFESAAESFRETTIGVILTGASDDGSRGAVMIRRRGGLMIAEDPETAESILMPKAAIAAASIDDVLPLTEIAPFLVELARRNRMIHA